MNLIQRNSVACVSFLTGFYNALSLNIDVEWAYIGLCGLWFQSKPSSIITYSVTAWLLCFVAGHTYAEGYLKHFDEAIQSWKTSMQQNDSCLVQIDNIPQLSSHNQHRVKIIRCRHFKHPYNLWINLYTRRKLHKYNILEIPIPNQENFALTAKKRHWNMMARKTITNIRLPSKEIHVMGTNIADNWLDRLRTQIIVGWHQKWDKNIHRRSGYAIINALLFGEQAGIDRSAWYIFQQSATAHIIAISGLHIQLLKQNLHFSTTLVASYLRAAHPALLGQWVSHIGILIYGILAGLGVACRRACISVCIESMCKLWSVRTSGLQRLIFCASITSITHPQDLLTQAFFLSYGMTASIILLHRIRKLNWWQTHCLTAAIGMPLNLIFWHQLGLISPVSNIFAIPWVSHCIIPSAFITALTLLLDTNIAHIMIHWTLLHAECMQWLLAWIVHVI